jgi:hypothetical protein
MKPYLTEHVMKLMADGTKRTRIQIWIELGKVIGCKPFEVRQAVDVLVEQGELKVSGDGNYERR